MVDMAQSWHWSGPTAPFFSPDGSQPARFVLAQIGDSDFAVEEGFAYRGSGDEVEVSAETLVSTDLASIPWFMSWFVPVHGRHTPAALVHDRLVGAAGGAPDPRSARVEADDVFIEAMRATDVALLRRNLMFSAVTLATRFSGGATARVGAAAWVTSSLAGTAALLWALSQGRWWLTFASLLAPLAGGLLWGWRNRRQGMLAGYAVWLVVVPALACLVAYGLYWIAEQGVRVVVPRINRDVTEAPPPAGLR